MASCKREEDLGECVIDVRKSVVMTKLELADDRTEWRASVVGCTDFRYDLSLHRLHV